MSLFLFFRDVIRAKHLINFQVYVLLAFSEFRAINICIINPLRMRFWYKCRLKFLEFFIIPTPYFLLYSSSYLIETFSGIKYMKFSVLKNQWLIIKNVNIHSKRKWIITISEECLFTLAKASVFSLLVGVNRYSFVRLNIYFFCETVLF